MKHQPNSEDILKTIAVVVMIAHHYYLFLGAQQSNITIYILSRICMPIFAFFCEAHAKSNSSRIDILICAVIVQIVTYSVNSINILFSFLIGLFLVNKKQMYKSNPLCLAFFLKLGIASLILDLKLEYQLIPIMFMICGKRHQSCK